MSSPTGPILVIGATGQQGGAVARELLRRGHDVHALTRSDTSEAARELAARGARIVQGDLDDVGSLHSAMADTRAVFSVQSIDGPLEAEVRHGVAVADTAAASNIEHIVYTSVDGAERASGVPHFDSKWEIEQHLAKLDVAVTVLRPTAFMENFNGPVRPHVVDGELVVRFGTQPDTSLQMVAVADIGVFAANAFEHREGTSGSALALAGDSLTGIDIAAAMSLATGLPARYEPMDLEQVRTFSSDTALMFEWMEREGYSADIADLRRRHSALRSFADWLTETQWRPDQASAGG